MYNYRDFKIPYDRGIEIDQEVDAEIKKKQHTEIGGLSKISDWAGTGLTLTRSVDYRNPLYKNID